jgi:hypothetical protein
MGKPNLYTVPCQSFSACQQAAMQQGSLLRAVPVQHYNPIGATHAEIFEAYTHFGGHIYCTRYS